MKLRLIHINLFPYCFFILFGSLGLFCEIASLKEMSKLFSLILKLTYLFPVFLAVYNYKMMKDKAFSTRLIFSVGSAGLFYVFVLFASLVIIQLMILFGVRI